MNDTSPEMEKLHRELMMSRTSDERLEMASSMFETAREIAMESFGDIDMREKRVRLFLRFYGNDVDEKLKAMVIAGIRSEKP